MASDIIHLLPDSVANQIAAGEVIQRPSSVIKELVENAVDAGATEINVIIRDAGRTLIQVIDNGKGMTETDARMAFERHSTSKITQAQDLQSLRTMGFRGEALPSICAISQVELKTRTEDDRLGTFLEINGSKVERQEPCMCEKGSNFMVKNIFYNVPARRKFLKSDNVELSNIMREFERLALVNNKIHLTIDTGTRSLDLPSAPLKQRISDLWKSNLNMQLLPINVDTGDLVKIEGYICRPEHARRRNPLQFLIVNGRNMRHPFFHKAILANYSHLIAPDSQPCYFLKFEVDPATIDVNVHPTKNEIKFEFEQEIWTILSSAVKAALGKFSAVPSIDFNSDALEVHPPAVGQQPSQPQLGLDPTYNPFKSGGHSSGGYAPRQTHSNWEKLYNDFYGKNTGTVTPQQGTIPTTDETMQLPICLQFADKYIITSSSEGLLIIDQYRAHLNVLYHRFITASQEEKAASQHIMFPPKLTVELSLQPTLEEALPAIEAMGFQLEYVAGYDWQVTAVPSLLGNADPVAVLQKLLESKAEDLPLEFNGAGTMTERLALTMARSAAIERGRTLTSTEMEHLVGQLFSLPQPRFTPTGQRVFAVLDDNAIQALL